jgi:hypothetical protein
MHVIKRKSYDCSFSFNLEYIWTRESCLSLHVLLPLRPKYVINFPIAQIVISLNPGLYIGESSFVGGVEIMLDYFQNKSLLSNSGVTVVYFIYFSLNVQR